MFTKKLLANYLFRCVLTRTLENLLANYLFIILFTVGPMHRRHPLGGTHAALFTVPPNTVCSGFVAEGTLLVGSLNLISKFYIQQHSNFFKPL